MVPLALSLKRKQIFGDYYSIRFTVGMANLMLLKENKICVRYVRLMPKSQRRRRRNNNSFFLTASQKP